MPLVRKPAGAAAAAPPDLSGVIRGLSSPDGEQRWAAARAAGTLKGADVALAGALVTETEGHVREAMVSSLARLGTPIAVETLLSMLRSPSAAVRTVGVDALRRVAALPLMLERWLTDVDPDFRILCCELARSIPAGQASRILGELIGREMSENVCAAAIDVLSEVGDAQALPGLALCAERFPQSAFLVFSITTVRTRIAATGLRD